MPPKAKKKGKKGAKGKKKEDGGELSVEEMYKRTLQEVGSLREQLAERKEYARQSRVSEEVMRGQVLEVKEEVLEERVSKREITYDLTRQYKTMQAEMEARIQSLQAQVKRLQEALEGTQADLVRVREERDQLRREKEEEVATLNSQLHNVEKSYETILQESMDTLCSKIEALRTKWDSDAWLVEQKTDQILLEFGATLVP